MVCVCVGASICDSVVYSLCPDTITHQYHPSSPLPLPLPSAPSPIPPPFTKQWHHHIRWS